MTEPIRIAFVADIHHGCDQGTKVGSQSLPLLDASLAAIAAAQPDAIVDLGDRIVSVDAKTDLALQRNVAHRISKVGIPHFHLCGNNDVDNLSVADNSAMFGQPLSHGVVDLGEWQLVLWAADVSRRGPAGFGNAARGSGFPGGMWWAPPDDRSSLPVMCPSAASR